MWLRKFLVYLIVSTVFISGNGVVLAIHTCFASSTKTVSIFENDCCKDVHSKPCDSDKAEHLKDKCCVSQYSYHKLTFPGTTKKIQFVADYIFISIPTVLIIPKVHTNFSVPEKAPPYTVDIPILFSQLLI